MQRTIELLRTERRARVFFATLTQSSLGTGAAYVALLLVAYERFHSPWAISLVLLADLAPAMLLGPVFGAAADRWSRRTCTVVADAVRLVAFAGIALVGSFEATVALALLAGAGTGLFTPSALAALPSLVGERRRLPAATSLYGAIADLGFTAGPALAAGALLLGSPETILLVNAASFGASAVVLALLPFGAPAPAPRGAETGGRGRARPWRPSLLREALTGLRATARLAGVRTVLVASAAALFFGGIFNVGELLFATGPLGSTRAGYAVLVAVYGLGFVAGSLAGAGGGDAALLRRRFLLGAALMGTGFLACGLAPSFWIALACFGLGGVGNGMLLVYERLLIQASVSDALSGRVFGVKDALTAWAFGIAFVSAGAIVELLGPRMLLVVAGAGTMLVWAISSVALRQGLPLPRRTARVGRGAPAAAAR